MNRCVRLALGVALAVPPALVPVMAMLSVPALAQLTEATARVAGAAADQIVAAVRLEPESPPRVADPEIASLFGLALPEAATRGPTPEADEFGLLVGASAGAGSIARAYLLVGTGTERTTLGQAEREQARENLLAFLPELSRIYDFRLLACARLSEGAARLRDTTGNEDPAIDAGLDAIETEVTAVVAAMLSLVADRNIDDARRLDRMRVLGRNAGHFARFLDLRPSQALADQALAAAIAETNPEIGRLLKDFALAILR